MPAGRTGQVSTGRNGRLSWSGRCRAERQEEQGRWMPAGSGRKSRESWCRLEAAGMSRSGSTSTGCTSGWTNTHEEWITIRRTKDACRRNNPAPTWCADQAFKESVIALKLRAGVSAQLQLRSNHAPCHTHTDTGRHRSDWTSQLYPISHSHREFDSLTVLKLQHSDRVTALGETLIYWHKEIIKSNINLHFGATCTRKCKD